VIDRHAWNVILMCELPIWPAKWSNVAGANKQRTAAQTALFNRQLSDLIGQYSAINLTGDLMDNYSLNWRWKMVIEMISSRVSKLIGDQSDRLSNVHGKTGPKFGHVSTW